jgi:hypothetical protein
MVGIAGFYRDRVFHDRQKMPNAHPVHVRERPVK